MKTLQTLKQSGDTIIEVLIAMAVISLVLAGAYRLSTRSTADLQNTKEHDQANAVLQSQIELLRGSDSATQALIYAHNPTTAFCMVGGGAPVVKDFATAPPALAQNDSFGEYPSECTQGLYHLSVLYDASQSDLFTFRARWAGIIGSNQQVELFYRIHNPIAGP